MLSAVGDHPCRFGLCRTPRLPTDMFSELSWLPDPVVDTSNPDHYMSYDQVKGQSTDDSNRPSLQEKASRFAPQDQGCDNTMFTAQRVRGTVVCSECSKPRCFYSRVAISLPQLQQLTQELEHFEYSCGSPLLPTDSNLHGTVFVRINLTCSDHVEFCYYSSKLNAHGVTAAVMMPRSLRSSSTSFARSFPFVWIVAR